jgi:death on curing protein
LKEPVFLGLNEEIEIHNDQIEWYGGRVGIRDLELLKSAVAMPMAGFGSEYFHTDIYEMAAAYLFHIVLNHPFIDGNKRTGAVSALVFLIMNGMDFKADEDSLEKMVVSVAEGKTGKAAVAQFLRKNAGYGE